MILTRTMIAGQLAGIHEIKALVEEKRGKTVTRQYIDKVTRYPEFPEPAQVLGIGRVWFRAEIVDFVENKLERPKGRPRTSQP
ncbi:hypothetical protein ORV05_04840 [Amycolatopsis cynarae]|uniref:AlpA family phage regulatory protein n=1 Tax=Amycolatopsis cynarae TaxID=2995223 RepID=A0ABY7B8Q8_9PSEU|nr:hypothetical protein [Amycolatopsis sp. HUAS 11-8]WAL67118.1 hypothetical protein ORV05_04840 [Amycolatopsis sp. HUAS 11-8]